MNLLYKKLINSDDINVRLKAPQWKGYIYKYILVEKLIIVINYIQAIIALAILENHLHVDCHMLYTSLALATYLITVYIHGYFNDFIVTTSKGCTCDEYVSKIQKYSCDNWSVFAIGTTSKFT